MLFRRLLALPVVCLLSVSILAQPPNRNPSTPSSPSPADGATGVPVDVTLSWASDPNARKFEVYLGTANPPPLVATTESTPSYKPQTLAPGTTYYWQIVARGIANTSAAGAVWSFTTAAGAPPPPPSTTLHRLKVMTWNIQQGIDADSLEAVDAQVRFLADANADVIGLQEVTVSSGRDLRALYETKLEQATGVSWNSVWAPAPFPEGTNPEGNLVLTRLPVVSWSIKQFDAAPSDPFWLGAKRAAARVELSVNGRNLNVFVTHLDPTASLRTVQLSEFLAWANTYPAPRLAGGDFNMMPSEADYTTTTSQFDDAWTSLVEQYQAPPGPDPGYTKDVRSVAPWTGQPGRIDYWFHEKASAAVQPSEIAVLHTRRSDHHAVVMWVRVQ